jgi:hypothetical protein
MADEQDLAEALDDDKLDDEEFAPERPLGVEDYGTTAAEEEAGEPLAEAIRREEPDVPAGLAAIDAAVEDELPGEIIGEVVPAEERDIAQEHEGVLPAEAAAMHVEASDTAR